MLRQIKKAKNQASVASVAADTEPASCAILDNHLVMEHVNVGEAQTHNQKFHQNSLLFLVATKVYFGRNQKFLTSSICSL